MFSSTKVSLSPGEIGPRSLEEKGKEEEMEAAMEEWVEVGGRLSIIHYIMSAQKKCYFSRQPEEPG